MRRPLAPLLIVLLVAACSPAATEVDRPTTTGEPSTTTTSTTTPTTTTTTTPLTIDGAPEDLTATVRSFYEYITGDTATPPPMPAELLAAITPDPAAAQPVSAQASTGTFKGANVAVVSLGDDLVLAVGDATGWRIVGGHWPGLGITNFYGTGPRVIAVVGSDARPGEDVERTRADSIHFVGANPAGGAAIVGLPRDSYVPVPGHGKRKITGSLALGGPDLMMAAFRDLSGLPLEGYVLTGFSGFSSGIDAVLGGVEVTVPFAINDIKAKAVLEAGQQLLNGFDALAFARARKTVPGGDFTRSSHQGVILLGAAKGVKAMGAMAVPGLMEKADPFLHTDLSAEQLLTFAFMTITADVDAVPNVVAPGRAGTAGGASVVFLADSVGALFADLADGQLDG